MERGRPAIVATFDPHPVRYFAPHVPPFRLTTLEQREELFAAAGADATLVFHFDERAGGDTAEDFVTGVLGERIGARGRSHRRGLHLRQGPRRQSRGAARDRRRGRHRGARGRAGDGRRAPGLFEPHPRRAQGRRVREAARLLTRPFAIRGEVIHGDKRGREIGYPTANMELGRLSAPALRHLRGAGAMLATAKSSRARQPRRPADLLASGRAA